MPVFTRSVLIRTTVQRLYDFHLDTRNVALVQPPGMSVVRVELPSEIAEGCRIRLTVRMLGLIPQQWVITWATIIPPNEESSFAQLTDSMLEGPFPRFEQDHIFEREGDATRLTDRVTFTPPFGILGRLALPLFYLQLALMFAWRHHRTRRLLEIPISR